MNIVLPFADTLAKDAFLERFNTKEIQWPSPDVGFQRMFDFYRKARACDGLPLDEQGDMLIFQFGIIDWVKGEYFYLDMTRQISFPATDQPTLYRFFFSRIVTNPTKNFGGSRINIRIGWRASIIGCIHQKKLKSE